MWQRDVEEGERSGTKGMVETLANPVALNNAVRVEEKRPASSQL